MSHFTRVRTQLRDRAMLIRALEAMGYEVRENARVRGYVGRTMTADIVVEGNSSYDIGFELNDDGTYSLVAEAELWYGRDRRAFTSQVTQMYALETVREQAGLQGFYELESEEQADGSIRLVMRQDGYGY